MSIERRVDVFDLTDPDSRASYEDLLARGSTTVQTEQTVPMGDGSIMRVVDYVAPSDVVAAKPIYVVPVC